MNISDTIDELVLKLWEEGIYNTTTATQINVLLKAINDSLAQPHESPKRAAKGEHQHVASGVYGDRWNVGK